MSTANFLVESLGGSLEFHVNKSAKKVMAVFDNLVVAKMDEFLYNSKIDLARKH